MSNREEYKVSIITPSYNCEQYISDTIQSVISQTYRNWEMIIVDDCSTDSTPDIVRSFQAVDDRIKFHTLSTYSGAAKARNEALRLSTGRFVAYLDSDDLWYPEKLEKQVDFMLSNGYAFSCTAYEVISGSGVPMNKVIRMLPSVNYKEFLTNNLLQTIGMMADVSVVDKKLLVMPDLRRRQDAATWLQVLKAGHRCYGLNEVLGKYRRAENSLSSNKIKAVKGMWYLYRKVEKLPLLFSCYCFVRYAVLAVWKRTYRTGGGNHDR